MEKRIESLLSQLQEAWQKLNLDAKIAEKNTLEKVVQKALFYFSKKKKKKYTRKRNQ